MQYIKSFCNTNNEKCTIYSILELRQHIQISDLNSLFYEYRDWGHVAMKDYLHHKRKIKISLRVLSPGPT